MKRLLLFCAILIFTACANYTKSKSEPFLITGASYTNWSGGQPGVSGIKIIIGYKSEEPVKFQHIFFKEFSAPVEFQNKEEKKYLIGNINTNNLPGDVMTTGKETIKSSAKKQRSFPFKLKENQIAISYLIDNQLKYFLIEDVKETAKEFYQ